VNRLAQNFIGFFDHLRSFMGGWVTVYYKSKMAVDANANNFGVHRQRSTKVRRIMKSAMPKRQVWLNWLNCKPALKFQYGGRLFSETGSSNNSTVD